MVFDFYLQGIPKINYIQNGISARSLKIIHCRFDMLADSSYTWKFEGSLQIFNEILQCFLHLDPGVERHQAPPQYPLQAGAVWNSW